MWEYILVFGAGCVVGCAVGILWIRSIFRDPSKLGAFLGLSGFNVDDVIKLLALDKKEAKKKEGGEADGEKGN